MKTNTESNKVIMKFCHPDFLRWSGDWMKLNDLVDGGSTTVKEAGSKYLPPTSGQVAAWSKPIPGMAAAEDLGNGRYVWSSGTNAKCCGQGAYAYWLYNYRAVFYEYPSATVHQMIGRLMREPVTATLPTKLQPMVTKATSSGESLASLVEVIYQEQCKYSRCGILADFPRTETTNPPYLCVYGALRVLNWSCKKDAEGKETLSSVVLDDSQYVRTEKMIEYHEIIRVLALDMKGDYFVQTFDLSGTDPAEIEALSIFVPGPDAIYPTYGGKKSTAIPFVFVNATNTNPDPQLPILNNVAEMSLAIFRGEADYRQALFMQGQATPTFSGVSSEEAKSFLLGANGGCASQNKDFKALYMEVSGAGLQEMRESQSRLHEKVYAEGMKLINAGKGESGDALQERTDSQTMPLHSIATTCEEALTKLFTILFEWAGTAEEFEIKTNKEFVSGTGDPDGMFKMITAYNSGAPMTLKDVFRYGVKSGLIESSWEEVEEDLDQTSRLGAGAGEAENEFKTKKKTE